MARSLTISRTALAAPISAAPTTRPIHWKWPGFRDGASSQPFLIRRVQEEASGEPACWPWGRYAITLEFNGSRLFYGIRHDTKEWLRPDEVEQPFSPEEVRPLAKLLGEEVHEEEYWWVWWKWAGPMSDREFCLAVADGSLVAFLRPEIMRLAHVLDEFCQDKLVADAS